MPPSRQSRWYSIGVTVDTCLSKRFSHAAPNASKAQSWWEQSTKPRCRLHFGELAPQSESEGHGCRERERETLCVCVTVNVKKSTFHGVEKRHPSTEYKPRWGANGVNHLPNRHAMTSASSNPKSDAGRHFVIQVLIETGYVMHACERHHNTSSAPLQGLIVL